MTQQTTHDAETPVTQAADLPVILILRPHSAFGIVVAELRRVAELGPFMTLGRNVRATDAEAVRPALHELALACERLRPGSLFTRYANKKVFRREADFWATTDRLVMAHVKRMADRALTEAIDLAHGADIPILYAPERETPLNISDRLTPEPDSRVTPVMNFCRHDGGTTYRLQLRIGDRLVDNPSEHRLAVIAYEPGLFVLDNHIHRLDDGFSGKLLLPFAGRRQVEIPQRMENDYFRRFILKQVVRAEINAVGFDIADVSLQPQPCLTVERGIDGSHLLTLRFRYGNQEYTAGSNTGGRVTLTEQGDSFRFVRQLRDRQAESRLQDVLRRLAGADVAVRFGTAADMIDWLRKYAAELREQGFDVVQPSDHIYYIGQLDVEQNDRWHGDWLQTDVTVVIDNGRLRLPFSSLRDTILRGEQEYMLPTGERLLIPAEWLKRYADLLIVAEPAGDGFRRHRSQLQPADAPSASAPATAVPPFCLPSSLHATLRPYQLTGVRWLWQHFSTHTGCCLSDDMGLGKTLQTIALLLAYKEAARPRPVARQPQAGMLFTDEEMSGTTPAETAARQPAADMPYRTSLVVAPASVVHNWRAELQRFAPSLTVMTYTGDSGRRRDKREALTRWDVVLTTYRTLVNDIEQLSPAEYGIVVFDESQAFKTATSQIHQAVCRLSALHRLALSGTPVENNLAELWSLMNVLNPCLLGDAQSFQHGFAGPIARQMETERRKLLRRLIAPYFLKRTKEEVLTDLPERQDEVVACQMTDEQTRRYVEELSMARNEWLDASVPEQGRQIRMLAALMRLRQIANGEGKLRVVFDMLDSLRPTQHKVLLFSEFVTLLQRVGDEMDRRGWTYAMLTGQTREREKVIRRFQQDAGCQFFLISLKAGGVGLNLTAADYVFMLDPWWNRAAEEQAIARAHRMGQQRSVFVYRFVAKGTLEEQILTLQDRKQTLIDSVMPFIL